MFTVQVVAAGPRPVVSYAAPSKLLLHAVPVHPLGVTSYCHATCMRHRDWPHAHAHAPASQVIRSYMLAHTA